MTECSYADATPFYCDTHKCGHKADGTLAPCFKPGCPHCRRRTQARRETSYTKTVEALRKVSDRVARLEAKSARLLGSLVAARREARSLAARLETMEMEQMKKEIVDGSR